LRAQRILESAEPEIRNGEQRITWNMPAPFPNGVVLKITPTVGHALHIYQNGNELRADKKGIFSMSFDARELVVRGAL
jgi:hypothetical protein